jgi:pyruvate dehydrogenase E2 component (dihydrolipoamide acetyltransferase)
MAEIVMPRLSDSMEEGTILKWLKQVGEEIAVGEEIVEIETDKANMAYESDVAGTLTEVVAREGDTVPIGEVIARVGDSGEGSERSAAGPVAAGDPPPPAVAEASSGAGLPTAPPAPEPDRRRACRAKAAGTISRLRSGAATIPIATADWPLSRPTATSTANSVRKTDSERIIAVKRPKRRCPAR